MSSFDKRAGSYEGAAKIQAELADWGSEWLELNLSGKTAIEFGAGTGLFTQFITNTGVDLTATDLSPAMLAEGQQRVSACRWEKLDAWSPETSSRVDRLYSASLLQWCKNPKESLEQWRELLTPTGRVLCLFFIKGTLGELESLHPGITSLSWLDAREWNHAFERAGFEILRAEESLRKFFHEDAVDLLRNLRAIGATGMTRLDANHLRKLLCAYDESFRGEVGTYSTWNFFRLEVAVGSE
ncbi:MAG: methyltransferase [Opitutales bacterium]|nr:methyltransferase [Opitutales bacterium]